MWLPDRTIVAGVLLSAVLECYGANVRSDVLDGTRAVRPEITFVLPADTTLRRDGNGAVTHLSAANLSRSLEQTKRFRKLQANNQYAKLALAFVARERALFKLVDPRRELHIASVASDELGRKHVKLRQQFELLPVWGAELLVHLDEANHVYLVNGRYIPTPQGLRTNPGLRPEEARETVAADLGKDLADCPRCEATLVIFQPRNDVPRLAYHVITKVSLAEAWSYLVDAQTGAILDKYSTVLTGGFP